MASVQSEYETRRDLIDVMLNADQINFMRTIETVFSKKHHIEYSDLLELPFTNIAANPPQLLPKNDLDELLNMCKTLEVEVFGHA